MTLTIARVTEQGAWLAADRRASAPGYKTDLAPKSLAYVWSHGRVLIAAAGLQLQGQPMRAVTDLLPASFGMRGGDDIDARLERLRALMTEQLAPACVEAGIAMTHTFAGFSEGRPFLCSIRNRDLAAFVVEHVDFEHELLITGCPKAVTLSERASLLEATADGSEAKRVVRKFGAVIRAAAHREARGTVSAACTVLHLTPLTTTPMTRWRVSALGDNVTCEPLTRSE
jgi:hypothetical protein